MKIIDKGSEDILLRDMKSGQIGVITQWTVPNYVGRIVQRIDNYLFELGSDSSYWDNFSQLGHNKIRILSPGTKLEI